MKKSRLGFALAAIFMGLPPAQAALSQQHDWCKRVSARLTSVSMPACEKSGLAPTGAQSFGKVPILMRSAPVPGKTAGKPVRILLIGGIHGDELTSVSVVFQWLDQLSTPAAQKYHWHIVPLMNPDGFLAPVPRRMNARGVDLNRNFPTPGWERDAKIYWVRKTNSDPRRFPGTAPLSEPESRWLYEEIRRFKPDVIFSVHAPFGVLDFDGPHDPPSRFGRLQLNRIGVYPGSLGFFGGNNLNIPIVTIELPNARTMPPKAEVQRIWLDMLAWIEKTMKPDVRRSG